MSESTNAIDKVDGSGAGTSDDHFPCFFIEAAHSELRADEPYMIKLELEFSPQDRVLYKSRIVYMNEPDEGLDHVCGVVACHDGEAAKLRVAKIAQLLDNLIHEWPLLPEKVTVAAGIAERYG